MKITAYGHEIELTEPDDGVVTDVIIMARSVAYDDEGNAYDDLLWTSTRQTTGMIQDGMLSRARQAFEYDVMDGGDGE